MLDKIITKSFHINVSSVNVVKQHFTSYINVISIRQLAERNLLKIAVLALLFFLSSLATTNVFSQATGYPNLPSADSVKINVFSESSNGFIYANQILELQDSINHGNILYVATTGDNATAEKGNPNKPWRDPWTAKDSAVAGDLIFIYPGEWKYGDVSCTDCDYEADITDWEKITLIKDSISYYALPGVWLKGLHTTNSALFRDTSGAICSFLGHANLEVSTNVQLVSLRNDNSEFTLEANSFIATDEQGWNIGFVTSKARSLKVRIKEVSIVTYRFWAATSTGNMDTLENANIEFQIDHFWDNKADGTLWHYQPIDSCNILFEFKNVRQDIAFQSWGFQGNLTNSNYTVKMHNARIFKETENTRFGAPSVSGIFGNRSNNIITTNSTVTYDFGTLITNMQLLNGAANANNTVGNTNSVYIYKGTAKHNHASQAFIELNGSTQTNGCEVQITGNFYSNQTVISQATATNHTYRLSGLFRTTGTGTNVMSITNATPTSVLQNTVLINDGTTAPIEATVAENVVVLGVYSNSLIVDTDVTELVQPIIRDANVR